MSTTPAELAGQYFAIWNEADPDLRAKLIETTWSTDGLFVDPSFEAGGHEDLSMLFATAQQMFPGHAFSLTGEIEEHHNRLRWSWHLAAPGQQPVAGGTDVVTLNPDGKIREVIGFLNFAPAH